MIQRIARVSFVFIIVVSLVVPQPVAFACGPYFPETIFVQVKHPDLPFSRFAAGQLGVIQSSYSASFLAVAYRYLSGGSFSSSEQQQLVALWAHHYGREEEWLGKKQDAHWQWLEARYKVMAGSEPAPVKSDDGGNSGYRAASSQYYQYENCAEDAFLTAVRTLEARSKEFGLRSSELQAWLAAQDAVFDNCGTPASKNAKPELPEEAPRQLPAVLRADRAYQTAAAYFYAQDWDEAQKRFETIAADSSSSWRAIAAIVALRTKLRRITLSEQPVDSFHDRLAAIDAELRNLEQLPHMRELRPAIWRMRGFVEFRLDPDARRLELARVLENGEHPATLREDLDDYTKLLDRPVEESSDGQSVAKPPQRAQSLRSQSPMTDWIFTIQSADPASADHALARWQELHSLPWLVAALVKATPTSPKASELLQAAAAAQPASPGYVTVAFHRARLLLELGRVKDAIAVAGTVLAAPDIQSTPSAANLFRAMRMKLASNLDEFLQFAPRDPSVVTYDIDNSDLPETAEVPVSPLFDFDAASLLTEKIPTHMLAEAASSSRLPVRLRQKVAESAWVRAVMLNDDATALKLVPALSSLSSALADGLKTYSEAKGDARLFAAVFLILHHPELHPYISAGIGRQTEPGEMDGFRDNWWCSFAPPPDKEAWNYGGNYYSLYTPVAGPVLTLYPGGKLAPPAFLSDADAKSTSEQWDSLVKLNSAPDWLAAQVLAFAKSNPEDPRVPEALHLVVRATHLGCGDLETSHYSRAAFQLLHKRYPNDPWTAQTPYWY